MFFSVSGILKVVSQYEIGHVTASRKEPVGVKTNVRVLMFLPG